LSSWKRFGEDVSPVELGVDFLDDDLAGGDLIAKMMPFDADVLGAWSILFRFRSNLETATVVFVNDGLMHLSESTERSVVQKRFVKVSDCKAFRNL